MDGESQFKALVDNNGVRLRVVHRIEMTGHDLEDVRLSLRPPFTVRVLRRTPTQDFPLTAKTDLSHSQTGCGNGPFTDF